MELVSTRLTGETREIEREPEPEFDWGTELHLGPELIEKLKAQALGVGDEVAITAKAKVTRANTNEERKGEVKTYLDVQITDMAMARVSEPSTPEAYIKEAMGG